LPGDCIDFVAEYLNVFANGGNNSDSSAATSIAGIATSVAAFVAGIDGIATSVVVLLHKSIALSKRRKMAKFPSSVAACWRTCLRRAKSGYGPG
jgi:hypothetical protein